MYVCVSLKKKNWNVWEKDVRYFICIAIYRRADYSCTRNGSRCFATISIVRYAYSDHPQSCPWLDCHRSKSIACDWTHASHNCCCHCSSHDRLPSYSCDSPKSASSPRVWAHSGCWYRYRHRRPADCSLEADVDQYCTRPLAIAMRCLETKVKGELLILRFSSIIGNSIVLIPDRFEYPFYPDISSIIWHMHPYIIRYTHHTYSWETRIKKHRLEDKRRMCNILSWIVQLATIEYPIG